MSNATQVGRPSIEEQQARIAAEEIQQPEKTKGKKEPKYNHPPELKEKAAGQLTTISELYQELADAFGKAGFQDCEKFYQSRANAAARYSVWYDENAQKQAKIEALKKALAALEAEI